MEEEKEEQILVNRLSLIFLSLQTANSLMTEIDERYNRKNVKLRKSVNESIKSIGRCLNNLKIDINLSSEGAKEQFGEDFMEVDQLFQKIINSKKLI